MQVEEIFCRILGLSPSAPLFDNIAGCAEQYGYRNKMTFTSTADGFALHHFETGGSLTVHRCHLQDDTANRMLEQVGLAQW